MKKIGLGEKYRNVDGELPPLRSDVRFDSLDAAALDTLTNDRLVVLADFFDEETTTAIRTMARNWLAINAPLRVGRKALQKVIPEPNGLPYFLKRRPFAPSLKHLEIFPEPVGIAVIRLQEVNYNLYQYPPLADVYGSEPHRMTQALFNRTPKGLWFARHQDSQGIHGFGFAVQTAETLWRVYPSETIDGATDFTFRTHPGDVVVLRERAMPLDPERSLVLGTGYDDFKEDGSLVHTGLNLEDRMRYTMNLFSVEESER